MGRGRGGLVGWMEGEDYRRKKGGRMERDGGKGMGGKGWGKKRYIPALSFLCYFI